jgi:hypothetical protein
VCLPELVAGELEQPEQLLQEGHPGTANFQRTEECRRFTKQVCDSYTASLRF